MAVTFTSGSKRRRGGGAGLSGRTYAEEEDEEEEEEGEEDEGEEEEGEVKEAEEAKTNPRVNKAIGIGRGQRSHTQR